MDDLKRRREVLLGAKPEAPVDEREREQRAENVQPSDRKQRIAEAGIARASGGWDAVRRYAQLDDFFRLDWLDGDS